jgi:hypothetical protein
MDITDDTSNNKESKVAIESEISGAADRERLGKHVPRQRIRMQQRNVVFYVVGVRCYKHRTRLKLGQLVCEEKM